MRYNLTSNGRGLTATGRLLAFDPAAQLEPWTGPAGPPAGFTGPISPGYYPGDTRTTSEVDDSSSAWQYSPGWLVDMNASSGFYSNTYIHYRDDYGTAQLTYYGGGFQVLSHTGPNFCDADIYVGGVYNSTVSYYAANPMQPQILATIQLPQGLHAIEFRQKPVAGRVRVVNDGVLLIPKM